MFIKKSLTILGMMTGIATTGLVMALNMSEMQIRPAYSQASQCGTFGVQSVCVQPGKDPSSTICNAGDCSTRDIPRGTIGQEISRLREICGPTGPPGITCSVAPP